MRRLDGKWQRLTKRTHGTGSGGEKAVALTLPMFAAASAHYQSADPLAPRPIILDEVFAGIDSDMRGKCMGLLEAFDLDFIMTSEREWGCYDRFRPAVADRQAALGWYEQIWERGVLRRLSGKSAEQAGQLLDQAVRVVERLPAQGISLAELAAECCGDSHALDPGQPVGTLAIRAAAALGDVQLRRTASSRRRAWDAVGVICDELSAPVLVLNLPASGASVTSQLLQISAAAGEPCRITARQLFRHPPAFDSLARDGVVFVCENPTVVAAAANQLGAAARPLVCIDGQPTTAARLLLNLLSGAGATLYYHGDFDWGGVRIANLIVADHQVVPWRMSTTDYIAAAASGGRELRGSAVPAMWDHGLSAAMSERGVAIHEERVVPLLIADLRSPPQ